MAVLFAGSKVNKIQWKYIRLAAECKETKSSNGIGSNITCCGYVTAGCATTIDPGGAIISCHYNVSNDPVGKILFSCIPVQMHIGCASGYLVNSPVFMRISSSQRR